MKSGLHCFDSYEEMKRMFFVFSEANSLRWRKTQRCGVMSLGPHDVPSFLKSKKNLSWSSRSRRAKGVCIRYDGIPYVTAGREFYTCHHGPDVDKLQKVKRRQKGSACQKDSLALQLKRNHFQTTKKKDCPATVEMLHIIKLPDFSIHSNSRWSRTKAAQRFHVELEFSKLEQIGKWRLKHQYMLQLPATDEHQNHLLMKKPSPYHLVSSIPKRGNGTTETSRSPAMEQFLRCHEDFLGKSFEANSLEEGMETNFMEENTDFACSLFHPLKQKCEQWLTGEDNCLVVSTDTFENEEFIFIHQSEWQSRLLCKYGNEICFIDAGHRTCSLPVPTYFVRVPTNVCHIIVGFFMCEKDLSSCIKKALSVLSNWNEGWHPKNFLVDCTLLHLGSIEEVFEGVAVYISDYHREYLWSEWLSCKAELSVAAVNEISKLVGEVAQSSSVANLEASKKHLMKSKLWSEHQALQTYYDRVWQPLEAKWVSAFRDQSSIALSFGRVDSEKENRWLEGLAGHVNGVELLDLLSFLMQDFTVSSYKSYVELNLRSSSGYKSHRQQIPQFLCHYSIYFLNHVMKRMPSGQEVSTITSLMPTGFEFVDANGQWEMVDLGGDDRMPYCSCGDWSKWRLPCKHLLKVVLDTPGFCWKSLSSAYTESPFFKIDQDLFQYRHSSERGAVSKYGKDIPSLPIESGEKPQETLANDAADGEYIITIFPGSESVPPLTMRENILQKWESVVERIDSIDDENLKRLDSCLADILVATQK